jgi:septum formation protein
MQAPMPRLVLASGSAARLALLTAAGLLVEQRAPAVDEAALKASAQAEGLAPAAAALLLAEAKAMRVARRQPEALVIAADQLLVCEGRWFDKPADLAAARETLQALNGRVHSLVTAAICWRDGARVWQHVATPSLHMRRCSADFFDAYLALEGSRVTASVGAYRLEGPGIHLFERIDGEHGAILGLPMLALLAFLRQHGVVTS